VNENPFFFDFRFLCGGVFGAETSKKLFSKTNLKNKNPAKIQKEIK
jgi:hypothetical protein